MEDIGTAILAAVEAGKLRNYVRQSGGDKGLAGLLRLADRHSAAATAALMKLTADPAEPVRFVVRDRPR